MPHLSRYTLPIFLLAAAMLPAVARAQSCSDIQLTTGLTLSYQAESFPVQPRDAAYLALNAKKKEAADAAFAAQVASGALAPRASSFTVTVTAVTEAAVADAADSRRFDLDTVKWGAHAVAPLTCANAIVSIAPAAERVETVTGEVKTTVVNGTNTFPLALHEGDAVPDYQNVSVTSPQSFVIPVTYHHLSTDLNGDLWETTGTTATDFTGVSSTVSKYANRQVVAVEEIAIDGVTYTAYQVHTELFAKTSLQVSSSDFATDVLAKMQRRAIDRHLTKLAGSENGFSAALINEWFVPRLGIVVKTEVYDASGQLMARNHLEHIQAP